MPTQPAKATIKSSSLNDPRRRVSHLLKRSANAPKTIPPILKARMKLGPANS